MIGPKTYRSGTENKKSPGGKELCETGLAWGHTAREQLSRTRPPPPQKLGQPVAARVWSARVGTRPTCSAYPGPAPPPTCHLGGVDLLTNKRHLDTSAWRERWLTVTAIGGARSGDERIFYRRGTSNEIQYFYNRIPTLVFFWKIWDGAPKTAKSRRPVSLW
jgi:hypothetical protein